MNETTSRGFISVDPEQKPLREVHNLLLSGVSPRPIALVSTISEDGIDNLAPFSFFNAFGANPPYIAFSPAYSGKDGSAKDTLLNLEKIPECVVHAVPFDLIEQVSLASTAYGPELSEFTKAGFETLESEVVRPKRVKNSPFHMECKVEQIIPLGGTKGSGNLVLCRVLRFHVSEAVMEDGKMTPDALDLIGRNGFNYYTRASGAALFTVNKPTRQGMGIDQLPGFIRESSILTGNDLGKLGSLEELPNQDELQQYINRVRADKPSSKYSKLFLHGMDELDSNPVQAKKDIEIAAKVALKEGDLEFAIHVLLLHPDL
ncbi:MAG: flavin reductase family protein [FCB group bacterium]|nr:flavin reductase family protein [FCB group bacterium]MBL7028175.1 flavin reductase family protein [Candidatus Neomarinimicrobiota bacterium]MBL7122519.1 flavin reductase family protein [Candidatus Neomarinimicrobiota bacterium]